MAYIDCLPSWSAFVEASAQDDEVAEMYLNDDGADPSPRVLEWTPERAELVRIFEAIQGLTSLVSAALGGSPSQPQPQPRPVTAADRLSSRLSDAAYDYLIDLVEEARSGGPAEPTSPAPRSGESVGQ